MEKFSKIPTSPSELPGHFADRLGLFYTSTVTQHHKKENGQFFTTIEIARLMASYSENKSTYIRLLDPGCGTGILSCVLIEYLIQSNPNLEKIDLQAYETDTNLIELSEKSFAYLKLWLIEKGIELNYTVLNNDFILENADVLKSKSDLFQSVHEPFDIIISNPPYFKLSKEDPRTKVAQVVVSGQPNIYSIFMAVAAKLLSENGEIIFITPRSFASGNYFKAFREFFFTLVSIDKIHLFGSRRETFTRDNVLQETVIMKGRKKEPAESFNNIEITSSAGLKDLNESSMKTYRSDEIIDFNTNEKMLHLPTNDSEEMIVRLFKSWIGNLNKYQIQISTGPVVSFRARDFIKAQYEDDSVFLAPLFWLHNVNKMSLEYPVSKPNKGQYIVICKESKSLLIPNKNYVLLRRFSSKDDNSRLIAAPYFCNFMEADFIGVENKVNYIYRPKGHLERIEVVGLCALLNSQLFDTYFRTFNGNVNVSATELREMSLPPLETIKQIGNSIILSNDYSITNVNRVINEFFYVESYLATA